MWSIGKLASCPSWLKRQYSHRFAARRVTWRPSVNRTAGSGDPRRTSPEQVAAPIFRPWIPNPTRCQHFQSSLGRPPTLVSEFVNQSPLQNTCEATDGLTLFRVTSCVDSVHKDQCTNDEFFTASQLTWVGS